MAKVWRFTGNTGTGTRLSPEGMPCQRHHGLRPNGGRTSRPPGSPTLRPRGECGPCPCSPHATPARSRGQPATAPGGAASAAGRAVPRGGAALPPAAAGRRRPPPRAGGGAAFHIGWRPRRTAFPRPGSPAPESRQRRGSIAIHHPRTHRGANAGRPPGGAEHGPGRTGPAPPPIPPVSPCPSPRAKFGRHRRPSPPALPACAGRLRRCQGRDKRHTDT